jgi:hypothetical protein
MKPAYWIVWVDGKPHRKETRKSAKLFAVSQRLIGRTVLVKAIGFEGN